MARNNRSSMGSAENSGRSAGVTSGLERLAGVVSAQSRDADGLISAILALVAESLRVDVTLISRLDGPTLYHIEHAYDRGGIGIRPGIVVELCDTYCATMLAESLPSLVVEDARADARFAALPSVRALGFRSYSGVPLYRADGGLYGTLCTHHRQSRAIGSDETLLLTLAGHIVMQVVETEELRARERRLLGELAASRQMRAFYETTPCGVMILDDTGTILDANSAAGTILGLPVDALRGRRATDNGWRTLRSDGDTLPYQERPSLRARSTGEPQRDVVINLLRPDGESIWLRIDAVPVTHEDGTLLQIVVSFIDITAHKRAEEALRHQALHDALTGLPNRTLLHDRVGQALRGAERARSTAMEDGVTADVERDMTLALLVMDLDHFKRVNDTLGHHYGDVLLQQIAARVQGAVRASDTVARLSGDEFAVLLPATDADGAIAAARAILATLDAPVILKGRHLAVRASIGIALYPAHAAAAALLRHADTAMYTAKRGRRLRDLPIVDGRWSMVDGRWSMVDGRWSIGDRR